MRWLNTQPRFDVVWMSAEYKNGSPILYYAEAPDMISSSLILRG
jgi:hypothetical protein